MNIKNAPSPGTNKTAGDSKKRTKRPTSGRPEDERLSIGSSFAYGFQHVLTMYGGMLVTAALFMGGLATLIQTLGLPFFGSQLPLVQGVSFASVATMLSIVTSGGGLPAVFGAIIVSAAIGLLIAPVFSKIIRFFPPVVTGTVITTIGLTLMPVAANWAMGGNKKAEDYGSMANVGLAAVTLALVLLLSKVGSATISRLSILLAMVAGTLIAAATGMADFSKVGNGPIAA